MIHREDDRYYLEEGSPTRLKQDSEYSAISRINGVDVLEYLERQSLADSFQDPDSLYNALLFGPYNNFLLPTFYPGAETVIDFVNGTTQIYPIVAFVRENLTDIGSANDIYEKFCIPPDESEEATSSSRKASVLAPRLTRRVLESQQNPFPNEYDPSGAIQGFWGGDISDQVAILGIYGFSPDTDETESFFQETLRNILQQSTQNGTDKLIIDLRGNGGGTVFLALDTLVQLFPDTTPDTSSNLRASAAMSALIQSSSTNTTLAQDQNTTTDLDETEVLGEYNNSLFAWQLILKPDGSLFKDIDDYYGPYSFGPGHFTAKFQQNYTNNDRNILDPSKFDMTIANPEARRPFAPENMVILTDGTCASACSILVENLKNKFGIMSITIGGRAQYTPMQTVGGVKGSRLFPAAFFDEVTPLYNNMVQEDESLADPIFDSWTTLASRRFKDLRVNGMNAFRIGDPTNTPIHFIYEASDCRIWWTPEMLVDQTVLWNRVAEIAFDRPHGSIMSSEWCVSGSTGDPTSISGGLKRGEIGPQTPPKEVFPRYAGWIINGTITTDEELPEHDSYGPGTISDGSSSSSSGQPTDSAALQDFRDYCSEYTGDAWLIVLMCAAVN
ncbi:hypothetical protein LTR84_002589 [Exophiala bonariae]|uniref:Tail specific protease domain-containing protein n=1 Tax=Exophiala bonariae TaxID=1690606 RepID=A0AAV9N9W6_9EURO|nr:hypothetical protein LTR84_002589 [Exophiala bonariae]